MWLSILLAFATSLTSQAEVAPGTASLNFKQVYERSLTATQSVMIQEASLAQSRETEAQARGSFFPRIDAIADYTRQHQPESEPGEGVSGAFRRADQRSVRVAASQPLFRGLSEFAGLRASKAGVRQQEALTGATRLALLSDVGDAFYAVIAAETDREDVRELLDANERRVAELKERVRIGRSRQAELLQALTQVESAKAQLQGAESRLEQARASFEARTGLSASSPLRDDLALPEKLGGVSEFLAKVEGRPDVVASNEAVTIAGENITVARAGHFPTLDARGNYYLERTGVLSPVKWDVGVALVLPIFAGGTVNSQVRSAADQERVALLRLEEARRAARTEVLAAHARVQRALLQLSALESAEDSARKNFEGQSRDFRLGLVSNLEVTAALNELVLARRALHSTRYDAKTAWIALNAAIGKESL